MGCKRAGWRGRRGAMLVMLDRSVGVRYGGARLRSVDGRLRSVVYLDQLTVGEANDVPRGQQMNRARQVPDKQSGDA